MKIMVSCNAASKVTMLLYYNILSEELLKMLTLEILEIIHKLFVIMWATRITPTSWKTSVAVLIDKSKGFDAHSSARDRITSSRPDAILVLTY